MSQSDINSRLSGDVALKRKSIRNREVQRKVNPSQMKVTDHLLHMPATSPQRIDSPVPNGRKFGWTKKPA